MASRPSRMLVPLAIAAICAGHFVWNFVAPSRGVHDRHQVPGTSQMLMQDQHIAPGRNGGFAASAGSFAMGVAVSIGAITFATRSSSKPGSRANVAARVTGTAPSLIQVLEQKGLLSTAERLRLLSTAENSGLGVATLESLGLLKLVEDLKLLSTAETFVTNPTTPLLLLVGAATLSFVTYLDISTAEVTFLQWVLAGALGAGAVVLLGVAVVIFGIASGARRSKPLSQTRTFTTYGAAGFKTQTVEESVTLLNTLEEKGLLSFVEESRLLSLASSIVNRPLTLTESLGVLSTLEQQGLLSTLESQALDPLGGFKVGGLSLPFFALAYLAGFPVGLLVALPGVALLVAGIALNVISAPKRT